MKLVNCTAPVRPWMTHDMNGLRARAMICKCVLLTITFAMLTLPSLSYAQSQHASLDSFIEVVRAEMQADRASIISAEMDFGDKDAAVFWPIYRQYEHERSRLDDGRVLVIKEYSEKYSTLTDADAKAMAERMFEFDSRLAALKKSYFKKFNKVLPAFTVAKFFQLDRRMDLVMDMKVESSLPPLTRPQDNGEEK